MASCFSVEEVIIKILQLDCNPFYNTCMHKKELFRDVSSLTSKKSKKYHNYFFFIKGILRKERAIFITQVLKSKFSSSVWQKEMYHLFKRKFADLKR